MPNWCTTNYVFSGNKHDINCFYNDILKWTNQSYMENGWGNMWLGNVLAGAGLEDFIDGNNNLGLSLRCRGEIIDISELDEVPDFVEENSFSILTETAWCPMAKMWQAIIDKYKYDIEFAFQAEECGCEVFQIYDPHGLGSFDNETVHIEVWCDDNDHEKYPFLLDLGEYTNWNERDFDDWLRQHGFANSSDFTSSLEFESEDSYVSVNYFEYINELYD